MSPALVNRTISIWTSRQQAEPELAMGTRLASGSPRFSPLAVLLRHFEERVPSQGLSELHSSLRKAIYLPSRLPLPHYGWEAILCVLLRALGNIIGPWAPSGTIATATCARTRWWCLFSKATWDDAHALCKTESADLFAS